MEKLNLMNPICLFKKAVGGVFLFPSRVLIKSSTSPDGFKPGLVKSVVVVAMVYSAVSSIQVETGFFFFHCFVDIFSSIVICI